MSITHPFLHDSQTHLDSMENLASLDDAGKEQDMVLAGALTTRDAAVKAYATFVGNRNDDRYGPEAHALLTQVIKAQAELVIALSQQDPEGKTLQVKRRLQVLAGSKPPSVEERIHDGVFQLMVNEVSELRAKVFDLERTAALAQTSHSTKA